MTTQQQAPEAPPADPPAGAPTDPPADPPAPVTQVTDPPETVRDPAAVLAKNTELKTELDDAKAKLTKFEADAEERRIAALSDHEKAIETAVNSAVEAERATHEVDLLRMSILQRSSGHVIDPEIAALMIDTEGLVHNDYDAIDKAIEEFLKEKPHLAVSRKRPGIDQGPQGRTPSPETANDWLRGKMGR